MGLPYSKKITVCSGRGISGHTPPNTAWVGSAGTGARPYYTHMSYDLPACAHADTFSPSA